MVINIKGKSEVLQDLEKAKKLIDEANLPGLQEQAGAGERSGVSGENSLI